MRLVWIRLRSLGDIVLTLPALGYLKQHVESLHITYVAHPEYRPLLQGHPWIDRLVDIPRGARGYVLALLGRAPWMREDYDAVINGHGGRLSAWLVRRIRAVQKIGFDRFRWSRIYTYRAPLDPEDYSRWHTVEVQGRLLAPLVSRVPAAHEYPRVDWSYLPPPGPGLTDLRRFRGSRPLVLVHPGARFPEKRWPPERTARLVAAWARAYPDVAFALFVGPGEKRDRAVFRRMVPDVFIMDHWSLPDVVHALHEVDVYVGFDTGIMHLAAATGRRLVVLWGQSHYPLWAPWRTPYMRIAAGPGRFSDVAAIPEAAVTLAMRNLLEFGRP